MKYTLLILVITSVLIGGNYISNLISQTLDLQEAQWNQLKEQHRQLKQLNQKGNNYEKS